METTSGAPEQRSQPQVDWLDDSIGFVVESAAGRVGHVTDVEREPGSGRAVALVVRSGIVGTKRVLVPVGEVAAVLPSSGRIVLNGRSAPDAVAA